MPSLIDVVREGACGLTSITPMHMGTLSCLSAQVEGLTTGFNTANPSSNVVTVGGLPCPLVAGSITATSLQCVPSGAAGQVLTQ